jgi:nicotinamide mononucleotide transporter
VTLPSPLELTAVVASALAVWLSVRRRVATWPVSIVAVSAYLVVFVRERLYADAALQIVFLAQSAYGWWAWTGAERRAEPPVRLLSLGWRIATIAAIVLGAGAVGALLDRHTDAAAPYWDAAASTASLTANQLLARRVLENWLIWMAADVVYIGLFTWKGLWASALLYVAFLGMCVAGLVRWTREYRRALESPVVAELGASA